MLIGDLGKRKKKICCNVCVRYSSKQMKTLTPLKDAIGLIKHAGDEKCC